MIFLFLPFFKKKKLLSDGLKYGNLPRQLYLDEVNLEFGHNLPKTIGQ